jgi:hypothetical protein
LKNIVFILFCALAALQCEAQPPIQSLKLGSGKVVLLLDSAAAAQAIAFDRRDGYFEKVNASEMSIQMRQPLEAGQTREDLLPNYVSFLKSDVASFDYEESKFTADLAQKMFKITSLVAADIFPDTLKLIKTKGTHYGDGVWYTRENCIVIPANELKSRKSNPFLTTLFHELFHVYSRLNPQKSAKLYQLIGFEAIGFDHLVAPEALRERVLYNPDGVDFAQKIALAQADGSTIQAVPIIFANNVGAKAGQTEFFGYVEFSLYQIEREADGKWRVLVKEDGFSSTLSMTNQPDFFRQIKDNTGYIIHPDEVLADNFSFIMQEKNGSKVTLKFSAAGKQLLADIEALLKAK